jgi:adenine deaminase
VLGVRGINLLMKLGENLPVNFFFTAPSCVPAYSCFETNGATVTVEDIGSLMKNPRVLGLGEVMNIKGVLSGNVELFEKIALAKRAGKRVDGHAPGLSGDDLQRYIEAGVESDHESTSGSEALEKYKLGMWIMAREGSASKDLKNILTAFLHTGEKIDRVMFCTDDINPVDLEKGYVNKLVKIAVEVGFDPFEAFQMATINPAAYFHLENRIGALKIGADADILLIEDLEKVKIRKIIAKGKLISQSASKKKGIKKDIPKWSKNTVKLKHFITPEDLAVKTSLKKGFVKVRAIRVIDKSLITGCKVVTLKVKNNLIHPNIEKDILQIAVLERYGKNGNVSVGFISGVGLKKGAIASTVAHDSHNIIVVGGNWRAMKLAVGAAAEVGGGLFVVNDKIAAKLELPVAGIISDLKFEEVVASLKSLISAVRRLGCRLTDPFLTLSFMTLPVIPKLKLTDVGLIDVTKGKVVDSLVDT